MQAMKWWAVIGSLVAFSGCSRTGLLDDDPLAVGCTEGASKLTQAYPTVMFVLDRSTSMSSSISNNEWNTSRWEALWTALSTSLPNIDRAARIGALLFPENVSAEQCTVARGVQLTPELNNAELLLDLVQSRGPGGGTPTADAISVAGDALSATRASSTARAMILATDGAPDCNYDLNRETCRCITQKVSGSTCEFVTHCLDDDRTIARVEHYAARGIPTYVVGIQTEGDDAYSDVLDAIAVAGGKPQVGAPSKYYRARSQAELDAALKGVIRQVGSCIYLSSSVPRGSGTIQLYFDGQVIPNEAWTWQDRDNGEILLGEEVCQALLDNPSAVLSASVICGK